MRTVAEPDPGASTILIDELETRGRRARKAPFGGRRAKCGQEVRHRRTLSDEAPSVQSPIKPIFDLFGVCRDRLLA